MHALLTLAAQGLPGSFPAFDAPHVLMANLLGSIVTVWAVLRIRDPQLQFGRYDAAARFLFAAWQIYAVVHGASVIILGFTVVELLLASLSHSPSRNTASKVYVRLTRTTLWAAQCVRIPEVHHSASPCTT